MNIQQPFRKQISLPAMDVELWILAGLILDEDCLNSRSILLWKAKYQKQGNKDGGGCSHEQAKEVNI